MRLRLLSLLCLLFTPGCGDDAPRSSLAACSFTDACADAQEECYVSQVCGPPSSNGNLYCQEEKGDRQCHRRCENNDSCGPGESCKTVELVKRTDVLTTTTLCFK
ncbi:hypothetical protein MYSTI_02496 [Myxococcus stipitatus DSM 14675]|uniref:Uncharacterized protein n=1 Tax=Myxococcus stipitatus (strain DSM 14675 / JCM 12634 / Mx s8) TaxID=1278073 RepID=L7U8B3_MYXSD|nr:hypothetical protein [Myxococcus stipitatus]AGC43812.1 hypothetical protein MYSTI_02496 [Myxococcus stipitatus DSM 14675]